MKPKIVQRLDINKEEWNEFVMNSSNGYAYHLYDMICIDRYKEDRDISFAIYDDDKKNIALVSMLHIEEKDNGYVYLHSRYGMVQRDGLSPKEEKKLCNAYREYIDEVCIKYRVKKLLSGTAPLVESLQPEKHELVNPLMKYGYAPSALSPVYTWIVNLNGNEDDLIKNCEQTTRQAIRKLEECGDYRVVESDGSSSDYNDYIRLHVETYTRTNAVSGILHEEYQRCVFGSLMPQRICRLFFLEDTNSGERIAYVLLISYKNSGYYWWGGSSDEKEVGVNKYLLWRAMVALKDEYFVKNPDKSYWFETGGAYVYARDGKYKGLNDFKKCFGCILHPIYRGEYILPKYE